MRNILSRKTLSQVAITLLVIIFLFYTPGNSWKKNRVNISIGTQWSAAKDQPAIIIEGFVAKPGTALAKNKEFFVPVSQGGFQWLQALMYVLLTGTFIVAIWLFIRLPYRVLYNIAKGNPFVETNTKDLRRIGWGTIITGIFIVTSPLLARLILSSSIPENVYYPFSKCLYDSRWWLFAGVVLLLVARAFKQGYDLHKFDKVNI